MSIHEKRVDEKVKLDLIMMKIGERLKPDRYSSIIIKIHDGRLKYEIKDSFETLEQMKSST